MTMDCQTCRTQMPDALYDTFSDNQQAAFQHHLEGCRICLEEYRQLSQTLVLIEQEWNQDEIEPPDDVWTRLEPQLDEVDRSKQRHRFANKGLFALAALLLLSLGLKWWPNSDNPSEIDSITTSAHHQTHLAAKTQPPALAHYLAKTQPLLLAIANQRGTATATGFELGYERGLATNLAMEALDLGEALPGRRNRRDRALLEDIRYLLLQVANLEETQYGAGMVLAREVLEEETILFRINLFELRDSVI